MKIKIQIFLLLNVTSCKNLKNQVFLLPNIMSFKKKNKTTILLFLNVKIILGLKSFKGMLCTVIEIKKGFQRDYKLIQYFTRLYHKTVNKLEWIILGYFERLNFVKFQSNFLFQEPNINRRLLLLSLRSPMFAIIYSFWC